MYLSPPPSVVEIWMLLPSNCQEADFRVWENESYLSQTTFPSMTAVMSLSLTRLHTGPVSEKHTIWQTAWADFFLLIFPFENSPFSEPHQVSGVWVRNTGDGFILVYFMTSTPVHFFPPLLPGRGCLKERERDWLCTGSHVRGRAQYLVRETLVCGVELWCDPAATCFSKQTSQPMEHSHAHAFIVYLCFHTTSWVVVTGTVYPTSPNTFSVKPLKEQVCSLLS